MPTVNALEPSARFALPTRWRAQIDDYVAAVCHSPDGASVAVGGGNGELTVLDAASGAVRWRAQAHVGGVLAAAWSPTGETIATGGQDASAKLFAARTGDVVRALPTSGESVNLIAWSPGGAQLATAGGRGVRLWDRTGAPRVETTEHASTVTGLAWNRRGTAIATCCYGGVYVVDVARGTELHRFAWKGSLISLAWSPDDKVIACGSQDCSVHFWRIATGRDSEMSGYPFKPRALAWDAKGSLLATGGDAQVCVWDFSGKGPEGTRPIQLQAHRAQAMHLAWSPRKGVLASGGADSGVLLWEPRRGVEPLGYGWLGDAVTGLSWHPQHQGLVAVDASGNVVAFGPNP